MLSSLVKDHQTKQAVRKEEQGTWKRMHEILFLSNE